MIARNYSRSSSMKKEFSFENISVSKYKKIFRRPARASKCIDEVHRGSAQRPYRTVCSSRYRLYKVEDLCTESSLKRKPVDFIKCSNQHYKTNIRYFLFCRCLLFKLNVSTAQLFRAMLFALHDRDDTVLNTPNEPPETASEGKRLKKSLFGPFSLERA